MGVLYCLKRFQRNRAVPSVSESNISSIDRGGGLEVEIGERWCITGSASGRAGWLECSFQCRQLFCILYIYKYNPVYGYYRVTAISSDQTFAFSFFFNRMPHWTVLCLAVNLSLLTRPFLRSKEILYPVSYVRICGILRKTLQKRFIRFSFETKLVQGVLKSCHARQKGRNKRQNRIRWKLFEE